MGGCWGFPGLAVPVAPVPGWQRGAELDRDTLGADGAWQEKELFHSTNPFFALPGWGESWRGLPLRQDRAHMSTPHHPRHPARRRHRVFPSSSSPASWKTARSLVPCAQERHGGGHTTALCPKHHTTGLLVQPQTSSSLSCARPPRAGKAQPCSRDELVPCGEPKPRYPGRQKLSG